MNKILVAIACLCSLAVALPVAATAEASPAAAKPPHILEFEYSEDYEGFGRHHSVFATLRGDAARVSARVGDLKAAGRLEGGPGQTSTWNFRDREFVRGLLDDLHADSAATFTVKAVGETRTVRKRCDLVLEPDDEFGDYASGDCTRA